VNLLEELRQLQPELASLKAGVRSEAGERIAKAALCKTAERLGTKWFSDLLPKMKATAIDAQTLKRYSDGFERLVKVSAPHNRKTSYIETLDILTKTYRADLILPLQTAPPRTETETSFDKLFSELTEADDVLKEAIACAKHEFYRAAAVLGWRAAVDRMHDTVERVGFTKFNVTSSWMASQRQGRFKRFNKSQNISSLSELRMVFDTDLLWILEGMQLIDSNQHTRLSSCFDIRNHGGHPGDAPVSEYNLLSFFSDLIAIVLKNPTFASTAASGGGSQVVAGNAP
jgi:hypothetical protein